MDSWVNIINWEDSMVVVGTEAAVGLADGRRDGHNSPTANEHATIHRHHVYRGQGGTIVVKGLPPPTLHGAGIRHPGTTQGGREGGKPSTF